MNPLVAVFLINMSGMDFSQVWLAKHGTHNWRNEGSLRNGVGQTFPINMEWQSYDIRVQYARGRYEIWEDFGRNVKRITITILPDKRWQAHYE